MLLTRIAFASRLSIEVRSLNMYFSIISDHFTGRLRIIMLRVIATMTYLAEECVIENAVLVSLLRIGYLGSAKITSLKNVAPNDYGKFRRGHIISFFSDTNANRRDVHLY